MAEHLMIRLVGASRRAKTLMEFLGLKGASRTTLFRLVDCCNDAQAEIARLTAERDAALLRETGAYEAVALAILGCSDDFPETSVVRKAAETHAELARALTSADASQALARERAKVWRMAATMVTNFNERMSLVACAAAIEKEPNP